MLIRSIRVIRRSISSSVPLLTSAMLQRRSRPTAGPNSHIRQRRSVYILLMCFANAIIFSTMFSGHEHRGITARLREVTETIRSASITTWASIPLPICRSRWSVICAVPTTFPWRCLAGSHRLKSTGSLSPAMPECATTECAAFAVSTRGFAPPSECKSACLNSLLYFPFLVSHHWQMYISDYFSREQLRASL